jgi:hypothetical protein
MPRFQPRARGEFCDEPAQKGTSSMFARGCPTLSSNRLSDLSFPQRLATVAPISGGIGVRQRSADLLEAVRQRVGIIAWLDLFSEQARS